MSARPSYAAAVSSALLLVLFFAGAAPAVAQADAREATRERLRQTLEIAGRRADVNLTFTQSTKNPFNFAASMTGLANSQNLEIIVSVTKNNTIGFRIYPRYRGGYINLDKAKDVNGLMRQLLFFDDQNFLYWGADDTRDVFSGYTITLESGFPAAAIVVVLRSIHNTDKFVGALRPFIDGSAPAG